MSSAIVENFKTKGSKLYATRYTEAGMQDAATMTYYPNSDVQNAIQNDPNVVIKAIQGILKNREQIRKRYRSAVSKDDSEDELFNKNRNKYNINTRTKKELFTNITSNSIIAKERKIFMKK